MKNESPPINLRAERKKVCENINRVVLGIKYVAFWKVLRVSEIPRNSVQWSSSVLGPGRYASVFQGVVLLREARSAHSL
jgi:hypothetical protein